MGVPDGYPHEYEVSQEELAPKRRAPHYVLNDHGSMCPGDHFPIFLALDQVLSISCLPAIFDDGKRKVTLIER